MTVILANTPVLETERLRLRVPNMGDLPVLDAFIRSDRSKFVRPAEVDDAVIWRVITQIVGMWALRGYGLFAVCPKDSDEMIAAVGPWNPTHWPEPELGWSIYNPDYEGKGIAAEAALATRAYAFDVLGWSTAMSYIHKDNAASIALADRLGCVLDLAARTPGDDADLLAYRHRAPEGDGGMEAYA